MMPPKLTTFKIFLLNTPQYLFSLCLTQIIMLKLFQVSCAVWVGPCISNREPFGFGVILALGKRH